jgi:hypothetical protein
MRNRLCIADPAFREIFCELASPWDSIEVPCARNATGELVIGALGLKKFQGT